MAMTRRKLLQQLGFGALMTPWIGTLATGCRGTAREDAAGGASTRAGENMMDTQGQTTRMPAVFVGHGSPMNGIEDNVFSQAWKALGASLPRPRAIVCVSAHWETRGTFVTANERPRTIHDFGGFPKALYDVQYPAPGEPGLARELGTRLRGAPPEGLAVATDERWGLDHGTWTVLRHMFPAADVPVLQLSLDMQRAGPWHVELGRRLAAWRDEGVLLVGSGNLVHNLRKVAWDRLNERGYAHDWAREADATFKRLIAARDLAALARWESLGSAVQLAVPTPEHYLPALYILGTQLEDDSLTWFNDEPVAGALTMSSFRIG
jgi:4,5-DOPA dioxygenase extradiol